MASEDRLGPRRILTLADIASQRRHGLGKRGVAEEAPHAHIRGEDLARKTELVRSAAAHPETRCSRWAHSRAARARAFSPTPIATSNIRTSAESRAHTWSSDASCCGGRTWLMKV